MYVFIKDTPDFLSLLCNMNDVPDHHFDIYDKLIYDGYQDSDRSRQNHT